MSDVSSQLRRAVSERASGRCEYCQLPQACQVATFPVDHILPRSAGGKTELSNLALACPRYNALKWDRTVGTDSQTRQEVELFNPRKHRWTDHFAWSVTEPELIEPKSAIGRDTVAALELNARRQVEIRRWLAEIGKHPPV